jgi:putative toxin-antitoxin system antitoxin component (TIGR02293 family)
MSSANPHAKPSRATIAPGGVLGRIEDTLGLRGVKSERDLASLVENRLPVKTLRSLAQHGINDDEIYQLVIPRRTLTHRIAKKQRLTQDESDRAVRIASAVALADEVFGSATAGLDWLRKPKQRFDRRPPLDMLATEAGARLVEEFLFQIDHGMPG